LFVAGLGGAELPVIAPGYAAAQEAAQVQDVRTITVTVLGMSCPFCAYGLQKKLLRLDKTEKIEVKLKEGLAVLTLKEGISDIPDEEIEKLVDEAGFEAAKIERSFELEQKAAKAN
jgi:mercuric ion binding protein